jgi:hypothetical protein
MAITLLGHQPIDFTYKENDPCENISAMCLQYETGDNPQFQLKNTGDTAPFVTIQGISDTSFNEVSLTAEVSGDFYTYTVNFEALGITEGCYEICVYDIGSVGTNLVTNGTFNTNLSGWTVIDALVLDIDSYTPPTGEFATDGEVVLLAAGGTGPYTYSIDGVAYQASATFTGLSFGIEYTFYVKDANNVIDTLEFRFIECGDFANSFLFDISDIKLYEISGCYLADFE